MVKKLQFLIMMVLVSCGHAELRRDESSEKNAPQLSELSTEVEFRTGQASLDQRAKRELKKLLEQARSRGEIERVKVISWGDRSDFPVSGQMKLAEKRTESIEKHLESISKIEDVELISMAEKPSSLDSFRDQSEVSEFDMFEPLGAPAASNDSSKAPRKASKSLVIFVMEE